MAKFLAGVLSVIAVGVMLIAYGLLSPRAAAYRDLGARPVFANEQLPLTDDPYAARIAYGSPYAGVYAPAPAASYGLASYPVARYPVAAGPIPTAFTTAAPQRTANRTIERPGRNWGKTALIIGGSSAAGAGVGGLIGGKKGALIGAAIGGGASTIFESQK